MAIKLISNYAKRLGLPGYSSHQFSVSVETELNNIEEINAELSRIYHDLQEAVDREIQATGFVPDDSYGQNGNHRPNGSPYQPNGNHRETSPPPPSGQAGWKCSDKQKSFILKLVKQHQIDHEDLDALAISRFGSGLTQLNKLQASGLISEMLELYGGGNRNSANGHKGGQR